MYDYIHLEFIEFNEGKAIDYKILNLNSLILKLKRLLNFLATFIWSPMTCIQSADGRHWILRLMYFYYPSTRYLPGDALVITFFLHRNFFWQTAANTDAISFRTHSQQPSTSNSDCKLLLIAPIYLKPMPATPALL